MGRRSRGRAESRHPTFQAAASSVHLSGGGNEKMITPTPQKKPQLDSTDLPLYGHMATTSLWPRDSIPHCHGRSFWDQQVALLGSSSSGTPVAPLVTSRLSRQCRVVVSVAESVGWRWCLTAVDLCLELRHVDAFFLLPAWLLVDFGFWLFSRLSLFWISCSHCFVDAVCQAHPAAPSLPPACLLRSSSTTIVTHTRTPLGPAATKKKKKKRPTLTVGEKQPTN